MSDELTSPYWQLDHPPRPASLWRLLRDTPAAARPVLRIVRQAAPRPAALVLVLQLGSGLASAFGLLATTGVLDQLLRAGPTSDRVLAALPALLLVLVAYTARGAAAAGVALAQARIVPAVRRVAEEQLLAASLGVPLDAFDDDTFYDRLHRARDRGVFHLERATGNAVTLIGAATAVLAAAGSLTALHPALLPVLLLAVLPEGWAVLRAARVGYAGMRRTSTLNRRVQLVSALGTDRDPAAELRACQAGPFVLDEYRQLADTLCAQETTVAVSRARTQATGQALAGLGLGATFAMLGWLLHAGWIPLAVAGTAVIAIRASRLALTQLVQATNQLLEQGLYVADYQEFLADATARGGPVGGRPAPPAPRHIELHGVGFSYAGSPPGVAALRGIDLTLHAGQTVALVGENGSGKTTLAKLLAGLYRPTCGHITWDGVDLAELDRASVADRIVMVLQHPVRWPHDARSNVRIGRHDHEDPGDADLHAAAEHARADEVVRALPNGWRTLLSRYFRGGHELSGGQWQRLAVARGLYRNAPLLIWDEPTAPLDARAEYAVYESLRRLARGRTVVLITHRLASVRHADRIYFLHNGQVTEQGTHDELLAVDGQYAELYHLQARLHESDWARS